MVNGTSGEEQQATSQRIPAAVNLEPGGGRALRAHATHRLAPSRPLPNKNTIRVPGDVRSEFAGADKGEACRATEPQKELRELANRREKNRSGRANGASPRARLHFAQDCCHLAPGLNFAVGSSIKRRRRQRLTSVGAGLITSGPTRALAARASSQSIN